MTTIDALCTAAAAGDYASVQRLVADDRSLVSAKDARGWDALTHLCFSAALLDPAQSDAFVRAATALLDAGADPNTGYYDSTHSPKPTYESALYGAAGRAHHAPLTRLLLERGGDPNDDEVPYHAPESYDNAALRVLLDSGTLNQESLGMMLLRKTDWHDLAGVRLVLDAGADVNRMTRWGRTALHNAILSDNNLAIIELLLDRGADAHIVATNLGHGGPPRTGRSSIALAARRGRVDVLDAMVRRGIAVALEGVDQLIEACARGDGERARMLADAHAEWLRQLLEDGATLLAEFACTDNAAGVGVLLDLGVPLDARYIGDSYQGIAPDSTALHVAAWKAWHRTVGVLLARGADATAVDGKGRTPRELVRMARERSYWMQRAAAPSPLDALSS